MNKQERKVYVKLTDLSGRILCSLCKFAKSSEYCGEMPECNHQLWEVRNMGDTPYGICPGDDCWGFRPKYDLETCVDMVGYWIQGKVAELVEL